MGSHLLPDRHQRGVLQPEIIFNALNCLEQIARYMSPLTIGSFDRCSRANGTVYAKEMCWPISMRRFSTVKSLKGTCRRRWHSVTRNESYGGGPQSSRSSCVNVMCRFMLPNVGVVPRLRRRAAP